MTKSIGYGSSLTIATTTGGSTAIGQIRNAIDGPGTDQTDVDTTTFDSSTNFRTFVPGLIDPGELTFQLVYDPDLAGHKRLARYHSDNRVTTFTLTHNSTSSDTDVFTGYVKGISRSIPIDDVMQCDVTVKVSGDPKYTT